MDDPIRLKQMRSTLGDLSAFMKHLKQPIAWRANREDNCWGYFFERFLNVHAALCNLFNLGRHLVAEETYRYFRLRSFASWKNAAAV